RRFGALGGPMRLFITDAANSPNCHRVYQQAHIVVNRFPSTQFSGFPGGTTRKEGFCKTNADLARRAKSVRLREKTSSDTKLLRASSASRAAPAVPAKSRPFSASGAQRKKR